MKRGVWKNATTYKLEGTLVNRFCAYSDRNLFRYPIYVADLSSLPHLSPSFFLFFGDFFFFFFFYKSLSLSISVLTDKNGQITMLWQGGVEERAMDSGRRPETLGLHWRTRPWELASFAIKSWWSSALNSAWRWVFWV